jgi:hypothetical protein
MRQEILDFESAASIPEFMPLSAGEGLQRLPRALIGFS